MITGKIYELYNTATGKCIYIGSTTKSLKERLQQHKCHLKVYTERPIYKYITENNIDYDIRILTEVECITKEKLKKLEGCYIKQNIEKIYNKNIAGRSMQEYYKNNIDHIKEYKKEYYKNNIDHIKEYYKNNIDHIKEYYKNNIDHIKEYYKNNIDHIKEYRLQNTDKYKCDNCEYMTYDKSKFKRHQNRKNPCG